MGWARRAPQATATVEVWGPDPAGSDQAYGLLDAINSRLQGFTGPNPAGWGLAGSVETTDSQLWASPQAFTGSAGLVAHSTYREGGGSPVIYDAEADYEFDMVTVPAQIPTGGQ